MLFKGKGKIVFLFGLLFGMVIMTPFSNEIVTIVSGYSTGSNPFDQDLNTTSEGVSFQGLTLTGDIDFGNNNLNNIGNMDVNGNVWIDGDLVVNGSSPGGDTLWNRSGTTMYPYYDDDVQVNGSLNVDNITNDVKIFFSPTGALSNFLTFDVDEVENYFMINTTDADGTLEYNIKKHLDYNVGGNLFYRTAGYYYLYTGSDYDDGLSIITIAGVPTIGTVGSCSIELTPSDDLILNPTGIIDASNNLISNADLSDYDGDGITWDGSEFDCTVVDTDVLGYNNIFDNDLNQSDSPSFVDVTSTGNFIGDGSLLTGITAGEWNDDGDNLYPSDEDNVIVNKTIKSQNFNSTSGQYNFTDSGDKITHRGLNLVNPNTGLGNNEISYFGGLWGADSIWNGIGFWNDVAGTSGWINFSSEYTPVVTPFSVCTAGVNQGDVRIGDDFYYDASDDSVVIGDSSDRYWDFDSGVMRPYDGAVYQVTPSSPFPYKWSANSLYNHEFNDTVYTYEYNAQVTSISVPVFRISATQAFTGGRGDLTLGIANAVTSIFFGDVTYDAQGQLAYTDAIRTWEFKDGEGSNKVTVGIDGTTTQDIMHLNVRTSAPGSPSDGDVVYADGTTWDPGSGEGIYAYYNSGWNYLG